MQLTLLQNKTSQQTKICASYMQWMCTCVSRDAESGWLASNYRIRRYINSMDLYLILFVVICNQTHTKSDQDSGFLSKFNRRIIIIKDIDFEPKLRFKHQTHLKNQKSSTFNLKLTESTSKTMTLNIKPSSRSSNYNDPESKVIDFVIENTTNETKHSWVQRDQNIPQ